MRSTKRWPDSRLLPWLVLRQQTAGRIARSAALLVGSIPATRANVPSDASTAKISRHVAAVLGHAAARFRFGRTRNAVTSGVTRTQSQDLELELDSILDLELDSILDLELDSIMDLELELDSILDLELDSILDSVLVLHRFQLVSSMLAAGKLDGFRGDRGEHRSTPLKYASVASARGP